MLKKTSIQNEDNIKYILLLLCNAQLNNPFNISITVQITFIHVSKTKMNTN